LKNSLLSPARDVSRWGQCFEVERSQFASANFNLHVCTGLKFAMPANSSISLLEGSSPRSAEPLPQLRSELVEIVVVLPTFDPAPTCPRFLLTGSEQAGLIRVGLAQALKNL